MAETNVIDTIIKASQLGKTTEYTGVYDVSLLFPIKRELNRRQIGVEASLPFYGADLWAAYEISWLNKRGKPMVAIAEFEIPCESPYLIESKSLKLYLNSFNMTQFDSIEQVTAIMVKDLSTVAGVTVAIKLYELNEYADQIQVFDGDCIDHHDVSCDEYHVNPKLLLTIDNQVEASLHSHLFKSDCLATGQPDWASIKIDYQGPEIDQQSLLRYLISYRNHSEFHEQCIERIFVDILTQCSPLYLTVYARFTRRGGLDINPFRSTKAGMIVPKVRLVRQ